MFISSLHQRRSLRGTFVIIHSRSFIRGWKPPIFRIRETWSRFLRKVGRAEPCRVEWNIGQFTLIEGHAHGSWNDMAVGGYRRKISRYDTTFDFNFLNLLRIDKFVPRENNW